MAASTASPWESPWLLMLLLSCAALLGLSTAASPKPAGGPPGPSLERYRRLVPYMTYYVAQGLAQRPAALQTLQHNGLEAFSPPGRVRGGGGGFLLPAYVVRGTPGLSQGLATGGPPRPLGALAGGSSGAAAAASTPSAGGPPPRTVFRFDFQQQPQQSQHGARAVAAPGGPGSRLKDQPFLPSPPLKPEDEDSEDYFKPVTDTANYYRGTAPTPTPGPPADQEQHLVVFPEDEARLRAKLRQQQKQQHHHQLLLQQQQLDDAYRLKLLLLQQQQLQQAKELRAHMQAQRQREHLRAQLQQERDIRALVQAQQAKRLREQQLQAQLHSQQQAQDLKQLRDQHLRLQHEQEIQAQQEQEGLHALREQHLQAQLQARLKEQDLKAQRALQLQTRLRALELKKLRAQQLRLQQDQQLHAQLQAHLHAQAQQAQRTQQQQQLLQEEELRAQMHMQHQRDHDAPTSPATAPAAADTEVEQQVVVSLEDVEKGLPPSAAAPDPATAPAPNELPVESTGPSGPGPSASTPTPAGPVVYAEEVGIPPLAENADPPMSSSKEIVAHLINGLQLSNKLPQSLTPENFDMSLKTILQLLKVLHKSKAANGPITTPARVKVSPDAPERDTAFYIGGGTVSQTFPAPSVEGSTPGRPGIDYPAYDSIPKTSFSCATQRYKGFFGDEETNCQVWHYCDLNGGQASFLCPNGTIFSQVGLTCDWWFNVRCASTAQLYVLNERLYKYILPVKPSFPEDYSGPDVDRYLTEKFREMQAKARGRKEKLKSGEKEESPTTSDESGGSDEPIETNQTEAQEVPANKSSEVPKDTQIEEQQKLDPDL